MRDKRRMTGPEFEAVRPLLNISEDRVSAARSALVDGQTLEGTAALYGWTRQAVGDAVRVVWRTRERLLASQRATASAPPPPGWEQVTLVAPSALVTEFRKQIARATPAATKKVARKKASKRVGGRGAGRVKPA